jgi:pilus assembly protein FimV
MDEGSSQEEVAEEISAAEPAGEIEFDLSDTGAMEEAPAAEDEFSLDIDASELDIDIQEEEAIAGEEDEIHDAGDIDIDFGLDDEIPADVEEAADEEIAIDLTEEADALNLDLGEEPAEVEEAKPEPEAAAPAPAADSFASDMAEEEDFDLSSLDDVDEVSTKLDLARAYLDMGDHEGTRGILEEVIAEGNEEQKKEASELMAKLD